MENQTQKSLLYLERFIRNNIIGIIVLLDKMDLYLENLDRARGAIRGLINDGDKPEP